LVIEMDEYCEQCKIRVEILDEAGGWGTTVNESESIKQFLACGHQQMILHHPDSQGRRIIPLKD